MTSNHAPASSGFQNPLPRRLPLLFYRFRSVRAGSSPKPKERRARHTALLAACLTFLCLLCPSLNAQTIDDGIMLAKQSLCAGALYTHDSWDSYWQGSLQRVNGNIGTITTQTITMAANYGVTSRLDFIINVPYVWTDASKGVLHGQSGFQDLTLAAKYKLISIPVRKFGALRAIAVLSGTLPMTNYTPDLQPLSLGTNSRTLTGRATLNFLGRRGLYLNGTAAYTFRGNVTLDRSSYYTNSQLYLSNQVAMPNLFNYGTSVGYRKNNVSLFGDFSVQQARGGGDIRPQDMPFVSNRTNFSKAGATVKVPVPKIVNLQYWFVYSNTFQGRNVGQASTFTTGLMYTLPFEKRATP
ncbi:transporter family protein [Tunturibacter empetritectus]|uniref:Uncharacterized protein n=1 Tax=Tunturiibacter lichenicola TaxID=2051959 RepID=A0A7W8J932_9BACT|nr:hypothetical protein [Edaphobacter lichenicola]MBB5344918.1 hypothetical protein [Edaphobacter lichenicola]